MVDELNYIICSKCGRRYIYGNKCICVTMKHIQQYRKKQQDALKIDPEVGKHQITI